MWPVTAAQHLAEEKAGQAREEMQKRHTVHGGYQLSKAMGGAPMTAENVQQINSALVCISVDPPSSPRPKLETGSQQPTPSQKRRNPTGEGGAEFILFSNASPIASHSFRTVCNAQALERDNAVAELTAVKAELEALKNGSLMSMYVGLVPRIDSNFKDHLPHLCHRRRRYCAL